MKYKNKNNKTVIRAEKVAGKFTTIPHRIIHDKRLSTDARVLLISILSDADSFDISRTGLCNRIGFTEYKLDKALKELITFGYIKKSKRHGQYFYYTISEYGNLNKDEKESKVLQNSEKVEVNVSESKSDDKYLKSRQFSDDIETLKKYLVEREKYINYELVEGVINKISCRNDIFEQMRIQDKEVKKNKIKHYKAVEDFVMGGYASKELKPKILKEVRRLITDEHKKPSHDEVNKIRYRISHNKYKNKVKKHGFDYETQLVDSYENPLD